jgi:hypothetical protein
MSTIVRSATAMAVLPAAAQVANAAPSITPAIEAETENARLVELGREIDRLAVTFIEAAKKRDAALARCLDIYPSTPEELVRHYGHRDLLHCADVEYDLNNERIINGPQDMAGRKVLISNLLKAEIIAYQVSRHTKEGKRLRRLARLAKQYEDAKEAARKQSGFDEADGAYYAAAHAIEEAAYEIADIEPTTMRGVLIYARAIKAFGLTETANHYTGHAGQLLGDKIAAGVLKVAA